MPDVNEIDKKPEMTARAVESTLQKEIAKTRAPIKWAGLLMRGSCTDDVIGELSTLPVARPKSQSIRTRNTFWRALKPSPVGSFAASESVLTLPLASQQAKERTKQRVWKSQHERQRETAGHHERPHRRPQTHLPSSPVDWNLTTNWNGTYCTPSNTH